MKLTDERCTLGESGGLLQKEHLSRYQFALPYVDGKKVLDIGCGTGYGAGVIASQASEVIAVDVSEEAIDYARLNCEKENARFCVADAIDLTFVDDEEMDVIISFEVIEHIPDYYQYLSEIQRVLKHDGTLIISTPNKKYHSPHSEKPRNPFHVVEFYLYDFDELLRRYFGEVRLYGQNYQTTARRIVRKLVPAMKGITVKLLPERAWKAACLQKTRDICNARLASDFSDKNVKEHLYLLAVCKK